MLNPISFLWNLKTQCDLPHKFHRPQVIEVEASQSQRIKAKPHTHGTADKTEYMYKFTCSQAGTTE